MESPVFEEFDPAHDCECPGCVHWRRVLPHAQAGRRVGHPASAPRGLALARPGGTALVVAAAALGAPAVPAVAAQPAGPADPADPIVIAGQSTATPQGAQAPLHGPSGVPAGPVKASATTRAAIIARAEAWVAAKVPYSMNAYWSDGYRQDCSGYVSMAWNLPRNEWTGSLSSYADPITKAELQPGDILLFHNASDPFQGSHVVIFGGWTNAARTHYTGYEQTSPHTRRQTTPYAYWSNSAHYVPYRYRGLTGDTTGAEPGAPGPAAPAGMPFPGAVYFGPGANNRYVTELGRMLTGRGGARFYAVGPGPRWTEVDRRATRAFQQAQGWQGAAADGLPGPLTWDLLVTGRGRDIPPATSVPPSSHGVPGYPGRAMFRPGAENAHVTQLGEQLVRKGFGRYYTSGPGPRWTEADRRNVEAFQRSQGWRGGAADGYPGPETWRRLFS
ncbi:peptidoglycan-binding protein [Streptomyces sp. NPDC005931]|uniref:peptidoglycan-binding protein n=1 Tax=Streptomyces sp. NPDC005931 TaxID=3364737 RepID=UPI0036924ABF